MKNSYFPLLILLLPFFAEAQIVNIPDANFKAKLLAASTTTEIAYDNDHNRIKIDTNDDGEIQMSEAATVRWLDVSSSSIVDLTGIGAFTHVVNLYVGDNELTSLPDLSSLVYLFTFSCEYNNFISLSVVSGSIYNFYCGGNPLTSLTLSGMPNLYTLDCSETSLISLSINNCNNLYNAYLDNNSVLTSLTISSCPHLEYFYVHNCHLASLTLLNLPVLADFRCQNNQLSNLSLNSLPSLAYVDCSHNILTNLNLTDLPEFGNLKCSYNQLTTLNLNNLPTLFELTCDNNMFTEMNVSGYPNLGILNCSNNLLSTMNVSNLHQLETFNCDSNQLESLYYKNSHNSSGYTFNYNPDLKYICTTAGQFNQAYSKLNSYGITNCEVNSYCTYTPGAFYNIEGIQKFDFDFNGCDDNDIYFPKFRFSITNGSAVGTIVSNDSGHWKIPVQAGTHTITPLYGSTYFNINPSSVIVTFPGEVSPVIENFCITPNGLHPDVEVSVLNANTAIPGFDATYKIIFSNKGTTVASGNINFVFDDSTLDFISAVSNPDSQSTGLISWNYTDLLPFETRTITFTLNLNSPIETPPLNQGDILHFTANANLQGDENPTDNTTTLNQTVFNAFDPNDKTCLEGDTITPEMVGEYVHYKIRFENTGNYYAAIVTVKDVIDTSKFDISTLTPIAGSHSFITRITNTNQVEFIFDNIMLPFDDANNDGYVIFKIKTKQTLVLGDELSNTAGIYFNYNAPVITNTAVTTVALPLSTNENENAFGFALYPNPVKDVLNISSKRNADIDSVVIFNTRGQEVMKVIPAVGNYGIDVSHLPIGSYVVKVASDTGSWVSQFLKE